MPRFPFLLTALALGHAVHAADVSASASTPLFNGRDLDGFYVVVKDRGIVPTQDLFTVADGEIRVYAAQPANSEQPFAGLVTKAEYADYRLTLEYKWGEKKFAPRADFVRDAGVVFHMHGPDVIWPAGVECQIQEGDTGDIWAIRTRVSSTVQSTIRNYAPAPEGTLVTRGEVPPKFERFHRGYYYEQPGWNRLELTIRGDHAVFKVNGQVVNEAIAMKQWDEASKSWQPLTKGKILLQAEGSEIAYRDIHLQPLTPAAAH